MISANSRRHGENLQARKLALHLSGPKTGYRQNMAFEMMHLHLQLQTLYADVLYLTVYDTTTYDEDGQTHCPAAARAAGFLFPQTPSVISQRAETSGSLFVSIVWSRHARSSTVRSTFQAPSAGSETGSRRGPSHLFKTMCHPFRTSAALSRQVLFHSMRERAYRIISAFPSWNRSDSER